MPPASSIGAANEAKLITTDSKHFFFRSPNLVRDLVPTHAEQVFVSDITYIKLQDRYVYLSLVTDLYSKKIMGYNLDDNMKVNMVKEALIMALKIVNTAGRPLFITVTEAYNIAVRVMLTLLSNKVCV